MKTILLLTIITICYASYNLLVKISTNQIESLNTPPIIATIFLQATALSISVIYFIILARQSISMTLPTKSYVWAIGAGLCIGIAEVLYFYLFRGIAGEKAISANSAIPLIVGGTIIIVVIVSKFLLSETLNTGQWIGVLLAMVGMIILAINST